jgi:hypothetical protein
VDDGDLHEEVLGAVLALDEGGDRGDNLLGAALQAELGDERAGASDEAADGNGDGKPSGDDLGVGDVLQARRLKDVRVLGFEIERRVRNTEQGDGAKQGKARARVAGCSGWRL